ncbi:pyridoxal phosphate-dependent aminotransferase [Chloroflexota bacterium]
MSLEPRPEIKNLDECLHGGVNYAELRRAGMAPEELIDFSVCTNPYMPPPEIKEVQLNSLSIELYPDTEATELRQRLSRRLQVPPECVLAGSGTTELIRLIALAYLRQGDHVLVLEPTYGEYEVAGVIAGAKLVKQWMRAEDGLTPRLEETMALIKKYRPRAVFICNPNNPTGKYLSRYEVEAVLDAVEDGLLVLDEAYVTFVEQRWPSADLCSQGNIVILRSMTKDYGLAGLRLGYSIASLEITDSLRRIRPPWSVNTVAQKVGAMVLTDNDYLEHTKERIREARRYLTDGLSQLGFPPFPSDTHFFLVMVGDAMSFRSALLKHGILVRDCGSFGLPEYIRIGTRTLPECQRIIAAIEDLKNKGEIDAPS